MRHISGASRVVSSRILSFRVAFFVAAMTFVAATAAGPAPGARAQGLTDSGSGEVQVSLCADTETPDMSVLLPEDGELFTANPVTIKVNVVDLGKALLYVNNTLLSTVMLGESATDFEASLTLPSGNHTVKVVGYDICNRVFATESLTVTMKLPIVAPPATSPPGQQPAARTTPTVPAVDGDVVVYHDTASDDDDEKPEGAGPTNNNEGNSGSGSSSDATMLEQFMNWMNPGQAIDGAANLTRSVAGLIGAILVLNTQAATFVAQQAIQLYASQQNGTKLQKTRFIRRYLGNFRLAAKGAGAVMLLGMFVV